MAGMSDYFMKTRSRMTTVKMYLARYRQFGRLLQLAAQCCGHAPVLCGWVCLLSCVLDEGALVTLYGFNIVLPGLDFQEFPSALLGALGIGTLAVYAVLYLILAYLWRHFYRQCHSFLLLQRTTDKWDGHPDARQLEFYHLDDVDRTAIAVCALLNGYGRFAVLTLFAGVFSIQSDPWFVAWVLSFLGMGLFGLMCFCAIAVQENYQAADRARRLLWTALSDIHQAWELLRERRQEKKEMQDLAKLVGAVDTAEVAAEGDFVIIHLWFHCIFFCGLITGWLTVKQAPFLQFPLSPDWMAIGVWIWVGCYLNHVTQASLLVMQAMPALTRLSPARSSTLDSGGSDGPPESLSPWSVTMTDLSCVLSPTSTLEAVSLTIEPGMVVGLVGRDHEASGLVKLFRQNSFSYQGRIEVDGRSLSEWPPSTLDRNIAYVGRYPVLLTRTVLENLTYGMTDTPHAKILKIIDLMSLSDLLARLPKGINTVLTGEVLLTLTHGEKQSIAVGRAMLHPLSLVILDHALTATPVTVEQAVVQYLCQTPRLQTVIMSTHRLAALHGVDRLEVFHQGRVVASGTHADLLNTNDVYRRLYFAQARFSLIAQTPDRG